MIPETVKDFFVGVQLDVSQIGKYITSQGPRNKEQEKRVAAAIFRIIGIIGFAFGSIKLWNSLNIVNVSLVRGVFNAGKGAAFMVISSDVFQMAKNATNQMNFNLASLKSGFSTIIKNVGNDKPHLVMTDKTILRPFWNKAIPTLMTIPPVAEFCS